MKPILPALLQRAPGSERDQFATIAVTVRIPAGKQILTVRENPMTIAFLITGTVRVYLISPEGREICLYRSGARVKVKLTQQQEFVIGGYTPPRTIPGWSSRLSKKT